MVKKEKIKLPERHATKAPALRERRLQSSINNHKSLVAFDAAGGG
jgi:hypothetical protein